LQAGGDGLCERESRKQAINHWPAMFCCLCLTHTGEGRVPLHRRPSCGDTCPKGPRMHAMSPPLRDLNFPNPTVPQGMKTAKLHKSKSRHHTISEMVQGCWAQGFGSVPSSSESTVHSTPKLRPSDLSVPYLSQLLVQLGHYFLHRTIQVTCPAAVLCCRYQIRRQVGRGADDIPARDILEPACSGYEWVARSKGV